MVQIDKENPNDKALEDLLKRIPTSEPSEAEDVLIEKALKRVLFEDVVVAMDDPPYSKATVDGYVILASGTALASSKRPMVFDIQGDIPPPWSSMELPLGKALIVKNGSYMAIKRFFEGHYAVLKGSEANDISGKIYLTRRVEKHENISVQGAIRRIGNIIFKKGHRIRPKDIFTLASQGILKIKVTRMPKVAIFSTGDELLPPTAPYKIGYKYDCNSHGLAAMVEETGGLPVPCGVMPDLLSPFIKKLVQTTEGVDMVLISGGTAAAKRKFTVDLVTGAGAMGLTDPVEIAHALKQIIVAAESIRPTVLGIVEKKPVICLAGQPEEAARGFRLFVRPTLLHLLGEEKRSSTEWSRVGRRNEGGGI